MNLGVDGVQFMIIDTRRLCIFAAKILTMSCTLCCGGLEEAHLMTEHDHDPAGGTFQANARLWFSLWLVGAVVFCVLKFLCWLFRAPAQ